MTVLKAKLARLIETAGPIAVSDYMAHCLFDPEHGYYTTREPFGVSGDFTTAPEISQMFGELVGVWVVAAWRALGAPSPVTLAEIGPGRGTLMKDMLRAIARVAPDLIRSARVAMIETSPRLAAIQRQTLAGAPVEPVWMADIGKLPAGALVIVGNELFDALPVRQFVRTDSGWHERVVGLDEDGSLVLAAGPGRIEEKLLPAGAAEPPAGAVFEVAPARNALMERICGHVAQDGGAGLFFDYGHDGPAIGDTLQAVRRHEYDDVLAHPGEADLTAHVEFSALARAARAAGLATGLMEQGEFLLAMGLAERAGAIGADADEVTRSRLRGEVERLAGTDKMGSLFKVLAVCREEIPIPPFIPLRQRRNGGTD